MKKILLNNFALWFLVLAASTLSLIFVQQQVLSAWQAPAGNPGDNAAVSVPLTINTGNVDVADNNLINVADLRVDTLTATTSVNVLGTLTTDTFNADTLRVSDLTIPYGSMLGVIDVIASGSLDITAANAVSIGTVTKAGMFSSGIAASGGISYGIYADTNASSGGHTNYAVAGVSNNAGGVGVYGFANGVGWAGYFSGAFGVAGSAAFGNDSSANGSYGFAIGHSAAADGDYSLALGAITVSGEDSVGINLDDTVAQTFSQANSMAIMGGNLGINTTTPSYKLHLVGDYYQVGMMQVRPTTALGASENIFYGNAPTGSNNSSNLLLLQNDGVEKFKVTALGTGTFASSISATQGSFSSGIVVSGSAATINVGATVAGTLGMKSGGIISFNSSKGSYFDFNDDDGTGAPACAAGTAGVVYNFKVNNVLCYCNGTSWYSMVNGKADALCATK